MEENNKKEKKKIGKVPFVICVIFALLFGLALGGGAESDNAKDTTTTVSTAEDKKDSGKEEAKEGTKEPEGVAEVEPEVRTTEQSRSEDTDNNSLSVGDSIDVLDQDGNMLGVTVTGIEVVVNEYDEICANIDFELENKSDSDIYMANPTDFFIFVDGYQYGREIPLTAVDDEISFGYKISSGYKKKFPFWTVLPDEVIEADDVEISIPYGRRIVVFKKDGIWYEGSSLLDTVGMTHPDGLYESVDGKSPAIIIEWDLGIVRIVGSDGMLISGTIRPSELPTYIQISKDDVVECGMSFTDDFSSAELASYGDLFTDSTYNYSGTW
ncbi:MAG: hypothetical protein NC313_00710 [Butyrivibrio sp.]|nr:hypothetical protein [Butyrivibrio sp.]